MHISAIDRLVILGPTGCGKTRLMSQLVSRIPRGWPILGVDPKPAPAMRALFPVRIQKPEQVRDLIGPARVSLGTFARGAYDPFLRAAWERGGITVVIDDLRLLMLHGSTDTLETLLIAGRERFVGTWTNLQRPIELLELFSESEWLISFGLELKKDRERLSERGFDLESAYQGLAGHDYFVHRRGWPHVQRVPARNAAPAKKLRRPNDGNTAANRGVL